MNNLKSTNLVANYKLSRINLNPEKLITLIIYIIF